MKNPAEHISTKTIIFVVGAFLALAAISVLYATYKQEYVAASDWYGYYEGSQLLKKGRVSMEMELDPAQYPAIAPLSYFVRDGKVLPQYPPGYPLLMAIAGIAGLEFYVAPLLGVLSVIVMFLLIKPLTERWIAGLLALAWAFAPIVVYGSTSVMSDLVAAFFIILSLYLYRKGEIMLSAFALGFSIIVRPSDVLYGLVFLPVLIKDRQWFRYGCYFAIPAALYGVYNWLVYGAPWNTGYYYAADFFTSSVFFPHLAFYAKETLVQFTPFLVIPAIYALRKLDKERIFYAAWFLIFFLFYCFWVPGGDSWWWTRFLLPGYPALFFLAALGINDLLTWLRFRGAAHRKNIYRAVSAAVVAAGLVMIGYFIVYGLHHSDIWEKEKGKIYYNTTQMIAQHVPADSYVGSVEFSGAQRLYTHIKSFFLDHPNAFVFIASRLEQKVPVYLAIEPWNRERPSIKMLLKLFHTREVLELKPWPEFYLYKVKSRNFRAWRARGLISRK